MTGRAFPTVTRNLGLPASHAFLAILRLLLPLLASVRLSDAVPTILPIRYDLQLQLPTASDTDPLIPTFFGTVRIDFLLSRPVFSEVIEENAYNSSSSTA